MKLRFLGAGERRLWETSGLLNVKINEHHLNWRIHFLLYKYQHTRIYLKTLKHQYLNNIIHNNQKVETTQRETIDRGTVCDLLQWTSFRPLKGQIVFILIFALDSFLLVWCTPIKLSPSCHMPPPCPPPQTSPLPVPFPRLMTFGLVW